MRTGLGFYAPRRAAVAPFSPLDIAGLAAWYDATVGVTDAGSGAVSAWADQSGNGRHLAASGSERPTTGTRTQNSKNVIDFNGANSMASSSSFTQGDSDTVFVVCLNDDGSDSTAQVVYNSSNTAARTRINKIATNVWTITSGTNLEGGTPDTNPHLITGVFGGASSILRLDGSQLASGTAGTSSGSSAPTLGATSAGNQRWDGWIAEVLHYDSVLSGGDIAAVEAYLTAKWGL